MIRHTWAELYREISECVDSITLADLAKACQNMDQLEYVL
jgi:DNA-binding IscR family transcriptional regulator